MPQRETMRFALRPMRRQVHGAALAWHRLFAWVPAVPLLFGFMLAAQAAYATDYFIIINDLQDATPFPVEGDTANRVSVLSCASSTDLEPGCRYRVRQPSFDEFIVHVSGGQLILAEPFSLPISQSVSDTVTIHCILSSCGNGERAYDFTVTSDPGGGGEVAGASGCSIGGIGVPCTGLPTETGSPQEAGTVSWSDGTVDHIQFKSDVDNAAVPEPSTLALALAGFAALVTSRNRGWSARRSPRAT